MWAKLALVAALAVPTVVAQRGLWQQCGGINWTGGTTCVSGATCTRLNDWYYQCLPSSSTSTTTSSTTTTTSTGTTTTTTPPTGTAGANYWFSFGDSYTQTGFEPAGTQPQPGNPLGNPPYPGYTAVGGTNWIDVNTVVYNKSLVLTYNYAYGGATIDATLVPPYQSTVKSLTDQVNQFLNTVGNKPPSAPWTSNNALFSFWIGINDIGNSWYQSGDRGAFAEQLLNAYFALVQRLYNVGARKFLFINVPPIERSPLMLREPVASQQAERAVINDFNTRLAARVQQFKAANSGVTTYSWDSHATFTTILNSPTAYGFSDATSYGNANSFWGNDYHPSSKAHTLFGQAVRDIIAGGVW